jgi:hypothetical protein
VYECRRFIAGIEDFTFLWQGVSKKLAVHPDLCDGALGIRRECDGGSFIAEDEGRVACRAVCASVGSFLWLVALPHPLGAGQGFAIGG